MWLLSNKVSVEDSGLLEGFCDHHCHLLPGVDDGVEELEETLQILKIWEQSGVSEVWMTPHIMEDYPNEPEKLKEVFLSVCHNFKGNIALHLAAENMMDGLFVKRLEENNLLTLGETEKRILVETSYYIPPMNMEKLIDRIKKKGYDPILAHPERYQYMNKKDYLHWKQKGVLLQLNIPSLVGAYGLDVQRKAEWLLGQGMYDFCGTDTHSLNSVYNYLCSMINKKNVKRVLAFSNHS